MSNIARTTYEFLLTRPLRDVTGFAYVGIEILAFLLTRPLRDVTHFHPFMRNKTIISTHTPLAGRDYTGDLV